MKSFQWKPVSTLVIATATTMTLIACGGSSPQAQPGQANWLTTKESFGCLAGRSADQFAMVYYMFDPNEYVRTDVRERRLVGEVFSSCSEESDEGWKAGSRHSFEYQEWLEKSENGSLPQVLNDQDKRGLIVAANSNGAADARCLGGHGKDGKREVLWTVSMKSMSVEDCAAFAGSLAKEAQGKSQEGLRDIHENLPKLNREYLGLVDRARADLQKEQAADALAAAEDKRLDQAIAKAERTEAQEKAAQEAEAQKRIEILREQERQSEEQKRQAELSRQARLDAMTYKQLVDEYNKKIGPYLSNLVDEKCEGRDLRPLVRKLMEIPRDGVAKGIHRIQFSEYSKDTDRYGGLSISCNVGSSELVGILARPQELPLRFDALQAEIEKAFQNHQTSGYNFLFSAEREYRDWSDAETYDARLAVIDFFKRNNQTGLKDLATVSLISQVANKKARYLLLSSLGKKRVEEKGTVTALMCHSDGFVSMDACSAGILAMMRLKGRVRVGEKSVQVIIGERFDLYNPKTEMITVSGKHPEQIVSYLTKHNYLDLQAKGANP